MREIVLLRTFEKGRARGRHRAKHYRDECPYGERKAEQRDAWLAGYDFGFSEGMPPQ